MSLLRIIAQLLIFFLSKLNSFNFFQTCKYAAIYIGQFVLWNLISYSKSPRKPPDIDFYSIQIIFDWNTNTWHFMGITGYFVLTKSDRKFEISKPKNRNFREKNNYSLFIFYFLIWYIYIKTIVLLINLSFKILHFKAILQLN